MNVHQPHVGLASAAEVVKHSLRHGVADQVVGPGSICSSFLLGLFLASAAANSASSGAKMPAPPACASNHVCVTICTCAEEQAAHSDAPACFGNIEPPVKVRHYMTTIGIIGAGHIGSQIARKAVQQGYDVVISNSRGPETLTDLVTELGPRAQAATSVEAAAAGDFAVVTVPLKNLKDVPVEPLAGKIVIDTNNYYFERDGRIAALDNGETTTARMLQDHLPTSIVAKGFNHITAADITTEGTPAGTENRRALATASDSAAGSELVTRLYDEFGFDAVNIGPLDDSWRVERDRPAYGSVQNAAQLKDNLAKAPRTI